MTENGTAPAPRRRRRWPWAVGALILLTIAVRLVLPALARHRLETELSHTLGQHVRIDAVALGVLAGHVTATGVQMLASPDGPASLSIGRLALDLDWWALTDRTVHVRELAIESPRIDSERLESGGLAVRGIWEPTPGPLPAGDAPEPEGDTEATDGDGWRVVVDRITVGDAELTFVDQAVGAAGLVLRLPQLVARGVVLPDRGQPVTMKLRGTLGDGEIRADATIATTGEGLTIRVATEAEELPLERLTPYVSTLGWERVAGDVSGSVTYEHDAAGRSRIEGRLDVTDLAVHVAGEDDPVLGAGTARIEVSGVDFVARALRLGAVTLARPSLLVVPDGPSLLPLVPARDDAAGDDVAIESPWVWSVERVEVTDGTVVLRRAGATRAITVGATARDLPGGADGFPLTLRATEGDVRLDAEGDVVVDPFGLDLALTLGDTPVFGVLQLAGATLPFTATEGRVQGSLTLRAGARADEDTLVTLTGTVAGRGVRLESADGRTRLAVERAEAEIERLALAAASDGGGIDVQLARLALHAPDATMVRELAVAPPTAPEPETPSGEDTTSGPRIRIEALAVDDGRIELLDRTIRPPFQEAVDAITIRAGRVRWPRPRALDLRASADTPRRGQLTVTGSIRPTATELTIETDGMALAPYNRYQDLLAGYRVGDRSRADSTTTLTLTPDRLRAQSHLVLRRFTLREPEGNGDFREEFGIPLGVALTMLRDAGGNVVLDVPVETTRGATRVRLAPLVGSALKQALLGTLTTPVKMLRVLAPGDDGAGSDLASIRFRTGRADIHPDADDALDALAGLLRRAPALRVRLDPVVGDRDRRSLARTTLRSALADPEPVPPVSDLDARLRTRLLAHLVARRDGRPDTLTPDQQTALDRLVATVEITDAMRTRLARERLAAVRNAVASRGGGRADQLVDGPVAPPEVGDPTVRLALLLADG